MISRLVWRVYTRIKDVSALQPLVIFVAGLVRRLFFPKGIEAGLWGRSTSRLPAHYPKVKRQIDRILAHKVLQISQHLAAQTFVPRVRPRLDLLPLPSAIAFSIVINTLNRAEQLRVALRCLEQQTNSNFEVIVVVGPCVDHTDLVLKEYDTKIRVARCPVANLSVSRNIGVSAASGDVVVFLDDDAVPEPTWLSFLQQAWAGTDYAAIGGSVRNHTGVDFQCRGLSVDRLARERPLTDQEALSLSYLPKKEETISTTGCNASFRREALMHIGGFDEAFVYFLDETDVNLRLAEAGFTQTYCFAAEVHHKYAASAQRLANRVPTSLYQTSRSLAYFVAMHACQFFNPDEVCRRLEDYRHEERQMLAGYVETKVLDIVNRDRMVAEIESGFRDGADFAIETLTNRRPPQAAIAQRKPEDFLPFGLRHPLLGRMKLVLLSQESPVTGQNGIAVWTHQLAAGLADLGHEVSVICRSLTHFPTVDFVSGFWLHAIVSAPKTGTSDALLQQLPLQHATYAQAVRIEVDRIADLRGVDLVMGPIWDLETFGLIGQTSFPVCVSLHTTYKLAAQFKPDWGLNAQFRSAVLDQIVAGEALILKTAPILLANSAAIVRSLASEYQTENLEQRSHIIPHSAEDWSLLQVEHKPKNVEHIRIVYFGRLEQRKGADLVIDMVPTLLEANNQIEIIMIGDGSVSLFSDGETFEQFFKRDNLGLTSQDRFVWTGRLSKLDLIAWVASADIVVLPSRFESFGLVYAEAASLSKAIVALDIPASREVLGDEAILISAQSQNQSEIVRNMTEAILALSADPLRRVQLGTASRQKYAAFYSPEVMINAVEKFAKNTLDQYH